jgi:hypothetical protein
MYHYFYEIIHLKSGKQYKGVHSTSNLDDGYFGSGALLNKAIKKHGKASFKKNILKFFDTTDEMFEYERTIVNEGYVSRDDTYNIRLGGNGLTSYDAKNLWSDTTYRERVISKSLAPNWNKPSHKKKLKTITQSDEYRAKMRIVNKATTNTPEWKAKNSTNSLKRWQCNDYRANMSRKTSVFMSGTKFIHHPELMTNKRIKSSEVEDFLLAGWQLGRMPKC